MATSNPSFYLFFIILGLASVSTILIQNAEADCLLATKGGGCPDMNQCLETCRPCYRGIGKVHAFCQSAGGGIPFDQCMCRLYDGAPCTGLGPPRCPKLPAVLVNVISLS